MNSAPLLTVAFPLHRSLYFLGNIDAQIKKLLNFNYKIVLSDASCTDNALDVLQECYEGVKNVSFLRSRRGLNWVEHHNKLLELADTDYFVWFSHDDDFAPDYCEKLINVLEQNNDIVLAAGRLEIERQASYKYEIRKRGRLEIINNAFPYSAEQLAEIAHGFDFAAIWNGVVRRSFIIERGLFVKAAANGGAFSEFYWFLGIALNGRLFYEKDARFTKRFHYGCLHSSWLDNIQKIDKKELHKLAAFYIANSEANDETKAELLDKYYPLA